MILLNQFCISIETLVSVIILSKFNCKTIYNCDLAPPQNIYPFLDFRQFISKDGQALRSNFSNHNNYKQHFPGIIHSGSSELIPEYLVVSMTQRNRETPSRPQFTPKPFKWFKSEISGRYPIVLFRFPNQKSNCAPIPFAKIRSPAVIASIVGMNTRE